MVARSGERGEGHDLASAIEALSFGLVGITSRAVDHAAKYPALTFQQWRILVVVGSSEQGLRVSDIAPRIGASRPSTSRLVRRLMLRDLVESSADPLDRRAVRLRLSKAGAVLREDVIQRRRAMIESTLADEQDDPRLGGQIARLAVAFDRWV